MTKIKRWTGTEWEVLDAKDADTVDGKHASDFANASHNHTIANVDNLQTTLDKKVNTDDYTMIVPYVATTGSANAYVATLNPAHTLVEGFALAVKINEDNTGESTIDVNGLGAKPILKQNGNAVSSGNLKAGSIYTLRYNGTAFILQGEGGEYGTATQDKVLTGYTIGTESGIVSGTMPNNGAKIITPSTTNQAIPAGYHNGSGYVKGDANLKPENIKSGVSIFGITGNVTIKSLGGYGVGDIIPYSRYKESLGTEWTFADHTGSVYAVAVDNNGYVYTGSCDNTVRKISPSGSQIWSFTGHTGWVSSVAVDNNGYVYTGSYDNTVRKIDFNGNEVWSFTGHTDYVYAVTVDNNGYVYSGSGDYTVRKINPNGNEVWSFTGHTDIVLAVAVDNNGYVYSGGVDETVKKISPNGNQVWTFTGHTGFVNAVAVDNNGYVYSGGYDNTVKKINPNGNQVWTFTDNDNRIYAVTVDNNGYVYNGGWDYTIKKIDPNGNKVWSFTGHTNSIRDVAVDNDGYVYSSSADKTVKKIIQGIEILK